MTELHYHCHVEKKCDEYMKRPGIFDTRSGFSEHNFYFEVKMSTTFLSQFIPRLIFNSSLNCKIAFLVSHVQIV